MSVNVSTEISKQDISAVMRQMKRAQKEMGRSVAQSVKFAAWSVADSLRAATAISAKKREVVEDTSIAPSRGLKSWKVKALRKNKPREYLIKAKNKSAAKKHPVVQIGNRGLAQKAWHFAQSRLGSGRGGLKVGSKTFGIARDNSMVTMRLKGDNPMVRIDNRLPYASMAFKSSGEQTISNAMERAGRRMAHIIDGQLAKKMGAK